MTRRRDISGLDSLRSVLFEFLEASQTDSNLISSNAQRELNSLANLLRLVDSIRADLRLLLIRVLNALSRRPDARSFVLVLLASARCFGHRGESGDFVLPAFASISVVTGEFARAVS